jgi:hypothetical protein
MLAGESKQPLRQQLFIEAVGDKDVEVQIGKKVFDCE